MLGAFDSYIQDAQEAELRQRIIAGRKIETQFIFPPIPVRNMDWQATFDDYDYADDDQSHSIGHGISEAAAIEDLIQIEASRVL